MKKTLSFLLASMAAVSMLAIACKEDPEDTPTPEPEPVNPKPALVNAELTIAPDGEEVTYDLVAASDWYTDEWTIEGGEDETWISVNPTSGKGDSKIKFFADANESGKARSVSFYVKIGEYDAVEIFVSQSKKESNVNETDVEFLKALVEGNMLGESTPKVEDWYNVDPGAFPGIGMAETDGKYFITSFDGAAFTDFPEKMHLPELAVINERGQAGLAGKRLPKDWDTPKLTKINLSVCGLVGPIPDGLAASPLLSEIYMDQNALFGALPHKWASTVLEVALFANVNNKKAGTEFPVGTTDNAKLGYLVPATLDVIMLRDRKAQGDKTQMKLGGATECTFSGFEEGWGQARYEKYDPNAVAGDKKTWSDFRLLVGSSAEGFDADLDNWAWYFSNMGYPDFAETIPHKMREWNQTEADAYTAKCEEEYKASL